MEAGLGTLELPRPVQLIPAPRSTLPRAPCAQAIGQVAGGGGAARVYVTGHSLGGAHAALAALALSSSGADVGGVWTVRRGTRAGGRWGGGRDGGWAMAGRVHSAAANGCN